MKKRFKSKVLSIFLCATLLFSSVLPVSAFVPPTDGNVSSPLLGDGFSDNPDAYEIYPVPHDITYLEGERFRLGNDVNLVFEDGIDKYTKNFLKEILKKYDVSFSENNQIDSNKANILVGIAGSNGIVDSYTKGGIEGMTYELTTGSALTTTGSALTTTGSALTISHTDSLSNGIDAYMLNAQEGVITILGKDTDSAFHGIATLQMMFSSFAGRYFLPVHIEDWAEMEYRGIVEGFYGVWNHAGRASLMRSSRDVKMNSFVYAAKGDEYHRSKWAELYPEDEIRAIEELVEIGKETKVNFVWSVHLETFFRGITIADNPDQYEERYQLLTKKFDQLYDAGVRRFDVLNDDFGSGRHEDVVALLNRLMTDYVDKKGDIDPIVYCPQGYNVSWSGNGKELEALRELDPRVMIYWTGQDVNSPITQDSINYLTEKTKGLKPVFWINYPVNEHAKSGIYLGEISHYVRDGVTGLAGAMSNPSQFTETNKVGLFQLGSLFWNNQNYSKYAVELWEDSFKYLQPEVYESYLTIGRNVANAPNSSRVAGFPESEYIKNQLDYILRAITAGESIGHDEQALDLLREFDNIIEAEADFRENCLNSTLVEELDPWLNSLKDIATAGKEAIKAVIALEENDVDAAWSSLSLASRSIATWDTYTTFPNNTIAKAGTKRLQPFVAKLIPFVTNKLTPLLNPDGTDFLASFYGVMGGQQISDSSDTGKMFDGNPKTYATFQTIQKKDDYFGIDMGRVLSVNNISILQGKDDTHHDYFHNATLEYSIDGQEWNTLVSLIDSRKIEMDELNIKARYVRLRLVETGTPDKSDYWTFIREFAINEKVTPYSVYTNVDRLKDSAITVDGANYVLTTTSNLVTLPADGYVGISLPEVVGANSIFVNPKLPDDIVLEYSINQARWEDISHLTNNTALRYVRIRNNSAEPVTFDFNSLFVSLDRVDIPLKMIETNLKASLKEGSWENVFDGKYNTFAWTNEPQVEGQYIIFDLGMLKPVHDVTLITDDGKPHVYNGTLSISADKKDWVTIATVVDSSGDSILDPPYRYTKGDGKGEVARYIKLEITKTEADSPYLKLNELEVNKTVEEEKVSAFSGKPRGQFEYAVDGKLSTMFTPGLIDIEDGYFEYIISDNVNLNHINILQDPNSTSRAVVKVQSLDGDWTTLGTLDKSANIFDTKSLDGVQKLHFEWVKGTAPAIAEIFFSTESQKEEEPEDEILIIYPNIVRAPSIADVTVNNGTPWERVGLPERVSVTLSNDRTAILPVDWSSIDYNALVKGEYVAKGRFILPSNIVNPAQITLSAKVIVKAAPGEIKKGNLALNQPVVVSGLEVAGKFLGEEAVDGNIDTRWSANKMKDINDMDPNNQISGNNWIIIDLGEGNNTIENLKIHYHAKANGTKYEVQVSNDKSEDSWIKIAEVNKAPEDKQNAVHEIPVTPNSKGRYVRIYFKELNIYAKAAVGVSIKEIEVNGEKAFGVTSEPENLALERPTYVSGTETADSVGAKAVDGNPNTRWNSNHMKKSQNQPEDQLQEPAWIVVDLGDDVDKISAISAEYFNLVYPTRYTIELSDSNGDDANWEIIKTMSKPHKGAAHPTDEIRWDEPIKGKRYMRLYFTQMNVAAAGHAIGLEELTVTGTCKVDVDPNIIEVNEQFAVDIIGTEFANLSLPTRAVVKLADDSTLSLPVRWEREGYNASVKDQALTGIVVLPEGVINTDNIKAIVHLTLEDKPQIVSATAKGITVAFGTPFESLKLPNKVVAQLDNGYSEIMSVTWKAKDYNPSLEGEQIINGILTLPETIENNKQVEAKVIVTVLPAIVETTDLEEEIKKVEEKITKGELVKEDYTVDSWNALEAALKDAKELLKGNPKQVEVTEALINLKNALSGLRLEEKDEGGEDTDQGGNTDEGGDTDTDTDEGDSSNSTTSKVPPTNQLFITISQDGTKLDLTKVDTTKPSVVIEVKPTKEGGVYVSIPTNVLAYLRSKNPNLSLEIKADYGSYKVPVNLESLIPEFEQLLFKNDLKSEDVDFIITIADKSDDAEIQEVLNKVLPKGKVMGAILDFSIEIISKKTGKSIGKADTFNSNISRAIAMPKEMEEMPETWGAFRYDEVSKSLDFVPAKASKIDGVWYVIMSYDTNSTYLIAENNMEFIDIKPDHWARMTIKKAAAKGLVGGVSNGLYEPNRSVTRAEFVQMIVNAIKLPVVQKDTKLYEDVTKDAWYYNAILKAKSAGLLTHFAQDNFIPSKPITREEMASILADVLRYKEIATTQEHIDLKMIWTDYGQIDLLLQSDIELIYKLGIMQGVSATTFEAKGIATRAQATVVQMNLLKVLSIID